MQLKNKRITTTEPYDIWNDSGADKKSSKLTKVHPSTKRSRKTTLPHPGQSYNPDPNDHANLLKKIAQKELEYQKEQTAINRALKVQTKVNAKELRKHEQEEMVAGIKHLIEKDANDSGEETDSAYSDYDEKDFEVILKDKKVKEKRKTKQQRLRQLKDKLQRKAAKLKKLKNIRLSRFDSIKKITKELDEKAKQQAAKQTKKHKKTKNQRLGTTFEPSDPIYCLSSELPSNLREVKCPMDAIVREQLESFQSRLLVEPTKFQVKKRKYKKKEYERQAADERER